jgi:hypothetical protein
LDDFQDEALHATQLLNEETLRASLGKHKPAVMSAAAATGPAPTGQASYMTDEDVNQLRRKHAFLADFSDGFIKNTPISDLLKIECTAMKMREMERSKDADDRLAANKAAMATTYTHVHEGRDNRWSELHPARFLPGAGCSAVRLITLRFFSVLFLICPADIFLISLHIQI